jgi:hypothetical protein
MFYTRILTKIVNGLATHMETDRVKNYDIKYCSMNIRIDVSRLPDNLKTIIVNDIKSRQPHCRVEYARHIDEDTQVQKDNNQFTILLLDNENNFEKIRQMTKDILIKRRIRDYVAIQVTQDKNKIMILEKHHAEQLGTHHCLHCEMAFENEIQLSTHQRIHYFI